MNRLTWTDVARIFESSGSLYVGHRIRKGNRYRLRFSSYDDQLLKQLKQFLGAGNLCVEQRKLGPYYRLELYSSTRVLGALQNVLPHLKVKRSRVEAWIQQRGLNDNLANP